MTKPTLRVIADQLGVSTATVSLAMRDSTRISEKMRKRVKAALQEAGYVYSRSAASLRTSKTHTVGVVLHDVSDPFFGALLRSMESALWEAGRIIFLCDSNECRDRQSEFIRKMSEYNADGIIVCPAIGTSIEDLQSGNIPLPPSVLVSRAFVGSDLDFVTNDDRQSAELAARRLLDLGHRRIAFVGGDPTLDGFQERLKGYQVALDGASIAFDSTLVRPCIAGVSHGFEASDWLLELNPRPTAAICSSDLVTVGFRLGLIRHGIVPGETFGLVGHEDNEGASIVIPPLTVTRVESEKMGKLAADMLLNRIENPESPPQQIVLESRLIIRGSCGPSVSP